VRSLATAFGFGQSADKSAHSKLPVLTLAC